MSEGHRIMMERIHRARASENSYLNKLRDYNKTKFELSTNIANIVNPTEEAKAKAAEKIKLENEKKLLEYPKSDAEKAKEKELQQKEIEKFDALRVNQRNEINALSKDIQKKFGDAIGHVVNNLMKLNEAGKIESGKVITALEEIKTTGKTSADTANGLLRNLTESEMSTKEEITKLRDDMRKTNINLVDIRIYLDNAKIDPA